MAPFASGQIENSTTVSGVDQKLKAGAFTTVRGGLTAADRILFLLLVGTAEAVGAAVADEAVLVNLAAGKGAVVEGRLIVAGTVIPAVDAVAVGGRIQVVDEGRGEWAAGGTVEGGFVVEDRVAETATGLGLGGIGEEEQAQAEDSQREGKTTQTSGHRDFLSQSLLSKATGTAYEAGSQELRIHPMVRRFSTLRRSGCTMESSTGRVEANRSSEEDRRWSRRPNFPPPGGSVSSSSTTSNRSMSGVSSRRSPSRDSSARDISIRRRFLSKPCSSPKR